LFWCAVFAYFAWRALEMRACRFAVAGRSMEPTLQDGDWVLVDKTAYGDHRPRIGDLVAARDPRHPARIVFKRVARRNPKGVWLLGDNPAESTDSRTFGWVADDLVMGRAWLRYWPLEEATLLY
jgi:nickel-type superoxide dismutase maturation protease